MGKDTQHPHPKTWKYVNIDGNPIKQDIQFSVYRQRSNDNINCEMTEMKKSCVIGFNEHQWKHLITRKIPRKNRKFPSILSKRNLRRLTIYPS